MTTYAMLVHCGTVFEAQCHSCPANRLNWRYMVHLGYCMVNVYKLTSIKVDFFDMDHNVPGLEGQGSGLQHDTRYVHKLMRDSTKIPGVKPKSQALVAKYWIPSSVLLKRLHPGSLLVLCFAAQALV